MEYLGLAEIRVLFRLSARQLHRIDRRFLSRRDGEMDLVAVQIVAVRRTQPRNQCLRIRGMDFNIERLFHREKFFLARRPPGLTLEARKQS
jgi:hypothetical protein